MHARSTLLALSLLCFPLGATSFAAPDELTWHDAHTLTLEGKGWADTAAPYDRLPAKAKELVREPVWNLSRDSAGMVVRFETDAATISARWKLTSSKLAMPHMSASGVSGLDLYVRTPKGWRWIGLGQPTAQENEVTLVSGLSLGSRSYQLYLPLYNGVSSLEIGVPAGASMKALPRSKEGALPLVFYGTSITQGACASRPGMAHAAILGRIYDRAVINLGFSGNGTMEPELARLLGEIDAKVYVIDCLPNMSPEEVDARTVPFVTELRKLRPATPILLVEDRTFAHAEFRADLKTAHAARRRALQKRFAELNQSGVEGLFYMKGAMLLGPDGEGTVDGSHPNDMGFSRQARAMQRVLNRILMPRKPK